MKNRGAMNGRILNLIGGIALVVALLTPFMVGCSKNVESVSQFDPVNFVRHFDMEAEQLYREATKLYHIGNYKGATEKFTGLIDKFPNNSHIDSAIIKIVLGTIKLEEYDKLDFSIFKNQFPKRANLVTKLEWYTSAVRFRRDYWLANKLLQDRLPGSYLSEPTPRSYLSELLNNEFLQASPYPELKGEVQFFIAQSFRDEANYARAYQEFDKITTEEFRNYPNLQAEAMYNAAFCLKALRIYDETLGRYTDFITQFPENQNIIEAYFDLGEIYADQKDYHSALQNFGFALQSTKDPKRKSEIRNAIGQTYYNQGEYEKAFETYELALKGDPDNIFTKFYIAHLHEYLKNWDKSIDGYKRIIKEQGATEDLITLKGDP